MPKPIRVGPSWNEVFFGAVLSFLLGVVLAAAFLILKPVTTVKELPKESERKSDTIYYIEGTRDVTKGRLAESKRKTFAGGGSVTVTEDELNVLATPKAPPPKPPAPKPKAGESPMPMTADATVLPPNFRIREGVMQIAVPMKVSALGVEETIIVLARGGFERQDGRFVFAPTSLFLGSCPLDRLPLLSGWVFKKFIAGQPVPEDIAASWAKLVSARVEGSELKLTMP